LTLDRDFLLGIGLAGWRVVDAMAKSGAESPGVGLAQVCLARFQNAAYGKDPAYDPKWQTWSYRGSREMREMREALEMPHNDARIPGKWAKAVRETYPKRKK
jgi:hypothetical protein